MSMCADVSDPVAVNDYWFGAARHDADAIGERNRVWFSADPAFDQQIRDRFGATFAAAVAGELRRWKLTPAGTLALVLLFDQFSRNIHRGTPRAFATDERALALTRDGVRSGLDRELAVVERLFFYLPLEHAEDAEAQAVAIGCYEALHADAAPPLRPHTGTALAHAREHAALIERFGRFPHRNLALGRTSTAAENAWLVDHAGRYGQG